ncbi:ferredoxin [Candidatus Bathyarchaeota archaeon]|nr:MAG: ferredoxin [Candidatus Bathyarchaeota archaeon]
MGVRLKVKVDRDACIGCGLCASLCPDVFELDDEGKSVVVNPEGCDGCDCADVAEQCPVGAITIEE